MGLIGETDLHGNVIAGCNTDAPLRVMFAGHADQIGLIVSHINDNGYIYTNTIGGWDPQQLIGQRMTIYTADGKEADKALALKKLADGGAVVVSANGQKVDPKYLRMFRDDVFVLAAPELAGPQSPTVPPPTAAVRAGLQVRVQALPVPVAPVPPPPPAPAPVPPVPKEEKS